MNADRRKLFAAFQLVRLPNVFTATADVLAGWFVVGGALKAASLPALLAASAAIYAAGCVLNDLCDFEIDARERPFRPLPSGRISKNEAWALALLLFAAGVGAAWIAGTAPFWVALALAGMVVLYDARTKNHPVWGPACMAACRAANLILGMSVNFAAARSFLVFPLLGFIYVFSLTVLSRFEVFEAGVGRSRWIVLGGWAAVVLVLALLWRAGVLAGPGMVFWAVLVIYTGRPLAAALLTPKPETIGRAVKALVLGIPILDAVYASGIRGWGPGLAVLLCLVPAVFLSRKIYVT